MDIKRCRADIAQTTVLYVENTPRESFIPILVLGLHRLLDSAMDPIFLNFKVDSRTMDHPALSIGRSLPCSCFPSERAAARAVTQPHA
jgi:hypothetical protein